jgi:hypothetical protein
MIEDKKLWKELICQFSIEGQPTKAVLALTCVGVFFICSVSDTYFAVLFFQNHLQTIANHSLRNTSPWHTQMPTHTTTKVTIYYRNEKPVFLYVISHIAYFRSISICVSTLWVNTECFTTSLPYTAVVVGFRR